jgi:kynurenine formamidase
MVEQKTTSASDINSYTAGRENWGRWGEDDQRGAVNLITAEKRVQAAGLVRSGRIVSLSRPLPTTPGPMNPQPAQHHLIRKVGRPDGLDCAIDYFGIHFHGHQTTHIDALCHCWDQDGMWGGRDPLKELSSDGSMPGSHWGGVDHWRDGIVTRGILLDVPRFRGVPHVTVDRPVDGDELRQIARAENITMDPGDALLIYCGRERLEATGWNPYNDERPGLHASCLTFIRNEDVSALGMDMLDANPNEFNNRRWTIHDSLYKFGVPMIDNCSLGSLAEACAEEDRWEVMFMVAPLVLIGGTGSPVNPLALL